MKNKKPIKPIPKGPRPKPVYNPNTPIRRDNPAIPNIEKR